MNIQLAQVCTTADNADDNDDDDCNGFSGFQISKLMDSSNHDILLDTGSTFDLFKDEALLYDIQDANTPLRYTTNGGRNTASQTGIFKGVGRVWFDKDAMLKIFSMKTMVTNFRVTFDSAKDDAFHVHMGNNIVKFRPGPNGLYTATPNKSYYKAIKPLK